MSATATALAVTEADLQPPVMVEATPSSLFDLIGQSSLVADGRALLVSIAPIKDALGARWDARSDHIHEVVERHFRKHLAETDICVQASETHVLIGTPDKSTVVAQALCYRALREVLTHFLGAVDRSHLKVNLVTELSSDHIGVRPITPAELERADIEVGLTPSLPPVPPIEPSLNHPTKPSPLNNLKAWPLRTADGRDLRVSFAVDPVLDLRSGNIAGHRVDSRILDEERHVELGPNGRLGLLPSDFERIDLAALARGMSQLTDRDRDRPSLVIQLSLMSISNRRARAALLAEARALETVMKRAVIDGKGYCQWSTSSCHVQGSSMGHLV